jgi:hypothetical protein
MKIDYEVRTWRTSFIYVKVKIFTLRRIQLQKFIFIEAHVGAKFDGINAMLEEGWKVIEIHASTPTRGENIHALVLIEKEDNSKK